MKYFQMIWTPMLRAMLHYLVIKIILVAFFFSCKASNGTIYKDSETIKDEYDLLDRKFMLWGLEHKEQMLKLSQPFFPKQYQDYAVCFGLELHEGDFIWIFHKKRMEIDM